VNYQDELDKHITFDASTGYYTCSYGGRSITTGSKEKAREHVEALIRAYDIKMDEQDF